MKLREELLHELPSRFTESTTGGRIQQIQPFPRPPPKEPYVGKVGRFEPWDGRSIDDGVWFACPAGSLADDAGEPNDADRTGSVQLIGVEE